MNFLFPDEKFRMEDLAELPTATPFSPASTEFCEALSRRLFADPSVRGDNVLAALAYWLRRSGLEKLRGHYGRMSEESLVLPRGTVFHIAPSNVDTIFVYSWIVSMLLGNADIVRLSSVSSPSVDRLMEHLTTVLNDFPDVGKRTVLLRYDHDDTVTTKLSMMADVRVLWGGDETISHLRRLPLPPHAVEMIFPDRFSFAVFGAEAMARREIREELLERFFRDAYLFDQRACSSVRCVVWIGDEAMAEKARERFWRHFEEYLFLRMDHGNFNVVEKMTAACEMAIENDDVRILQNDGRLLRVGLKDPGQIDEALHCGGGLFYEISAASLDEFLAHSRRKHQTLVYEGVEGREVVDALSRVRPRGFDRVVPLGSAHDFSVLWDGYDLMRTLSRSVDARF